MLRVVFKLVEHDLIDVYNNNDNYTKNNCNGTRDQLLWIVSYADARTIRLGLAYNLMIFTNHSMPKPNLLPIDYSYSTATGI